MMKNKLGGVCLFGIFMLGVIWSSGYAHASQDAPNDPYAIQCIDGKCYYITGKQVPAVALAKFEKELATEQAKQEKEEGTESE